MRWAGSFLAPVYRMLKLTIEQFMTRKPYTIGKDQPLTAAHRLMREHDIRHLPVLDGTTLVGVISQRDLHLIESLKGVDPDEVSVSEAMSSDVFTVRPRASIRRTVSAMATRKIGAAIVTVHNAVVGMFTVSDALGVLVGLLATTATAEPSSKETDK